jgi:hypothetical protein
MAQNLISTLKKITRLSLWSAAGGMLLVTLLHFLLPLLVDGQILKGKIQARLDPETYGRIDFAGLRLALLPLPAVVVTQARYALPGRVQLQAEEVAVHPHLPSLLGGRLRLDTLRVRAPRAIIALPAGAQTNKKPEPGAAREDFSSRLSVALARLPRNAQVLLDQGEITLQQGTDRLARFEDLVLSLVERNGRLHLDLEGASDLFERFQVTAQLDGRSLDGGGEIQFNGIRLGESSGETPTQPIQASPIQVEGDLHLAFETRGLQNLRAVLRTELPAMTLTRGKNRIRARQLLVEADAELTRQGLRASLAQLQLEQPRLHLSGNLAWDWSGAPESPPLRLEAQLRDTDATAVRAALVNMAGKGRPWKLWEIVGGGRLEEMSLHASGKEWRDLGQMRNLRLAGKASQAHIVVPGMALALADVNGAWKLDEGVLSVAPGATARYDGTQATNAALTVGLADPPQPIDLALDFNADLADLPGLLRKAIPAEKVQAELARVGQTQGRAAGKLRLSGSLQAPRVNVTARNITLTAHYDRLPMPVQIKAPELVYSDGRIRFRDLSASMGATSLDMVSGGIAWQPASELTLQGRAARLSADELFPWLRALPGPRTQTGGLQSLAGALQLSDFAISGSPGTPGPWQFQGRGDFDALTLESDQLSAPVTLGEGRFSLAKAPAAKTGGTRLDIQQVALACAEQRAALGGTVLFGTERWEPALALSADRLDLGRLVPLFKSSAPAQPKRAPAKKPGTPIDGRISVAIAHLVYGSYQWKPVRANATLSQGQTILDVTQADLCGISTVGRMVWNDQGLRLEVKPSTQGQSVQYAGGCLAGGASTERVEGILDIQGRIAATGRDVPGLLASLGGELQMSARDGRIINVGRAGLFTNLLSFLSVNNIVRGEGLNLAENDLPYKSIDLDFRIRDGVAKLEEAKMTTKPLNLVGEGNIDLKTQQVAIVLLVSPLTTADAVVQRIPIVGKILKGTLVAVPVEVKGPLTNPTIFPMSPKAVGSRLLGIMERTVMAPIEMVAPILPKSDAAEEKSDK